MRKTSRICMVVHGPYPADPRVARAVRVARRQGFEVDVIATNEPRGNRVEICDGAAVRRAPIEHRRGAGLLATLYEYVGFSAWATFEVAKRHLRRRYKIIHVNNPPDFLIVAALVPKMLGARVIFDIHDLSDDMFAMRFGERRSVARAGRVLRAIESWACRLANAVVTVHEPYRQELIRRGVPASRVQVVMNTVDDSVLPAESVAPRRSKPVIVYHGSVTPHYGVTLLVDAFAQLIGCGADAELEIFGFGDAIEEVREAVDRLGLGSRTFVADERLPQREVLDRVRGATVGVVPNLPVRLNRFALSSKLFEYVALGIPVVSAGLPTICSHFDDSQLLFFEPGNARSLASALRATLDDPGAARARAERARARYEAYRWDAQAAMYGRLISNLSSDRDQIDGHPARGTRDAA